MSTRLASRPSTPLSPLAEQFAPVLRVHGELVKECAPLVDQATARSRIENGQVGYDALKMFVSCGDLFPRFVRVLDTFEVAGLVSNEDCRALLDDDLDVDDLVCCWFTGDRTPRNPRRRIARQAAIVLGNALLRAATERVGAPGAWRAWTRIVCPCCGGAPDIALVEKNGNRTLVCARCDAHWRALSKGCLGCGSDKTSDIARIVNRSLDYDLIMCNSCGRYLKERARLGIEHLILERAHTLELDLAAEQRGLRI